MVTGRPEKAPSPADRDLGTSSTPAPADHASVHYIATPANLAGSLRDRTNGRVDSGELSTIDADYYFQIANFCESRNLWPITRACEYDWFGFGQVQPLFANDGDNGFWMSLTDVIQVSGMNYDDLYAMFLDDLEEDTGDVAELEWLANDDGDKQYLSIAEHSFAMRAMLRGPWSREFMDNTMGLFRHAAVKSGLADVIGTVVVIDTGGNATATEMSMTDLLTAGGMPTEDEARDRAFRGPLGGVQ